MQNCGRGSDITIIKINSRKDRFVVNKSGQIKNSPVGDVREADRGHYNASQTLNSAFCIQVSPSGLPASVLQRVHRCRDSASAKNKVFT